MMDEGVSERKLVRWLLPMAGVATVASIVAVVLRMPLGPAGQWRRCYTSERVWSNVAPAGAVLLVFCALCAVRPRRRLVRGVWWAGVGSTLALGYLAVCLSGKFGVAELAGPFAFPGANGSYYTEGEKIGPYFSAAQKRRRGVPVFVDVSDYLDSYASYAPREVFPGDTVRIGTHPPGAALACYAIEAVLRRWPGAADALVSAYRSLFPSEIGRAMFDRTRPASSRLFVAGVTTIGLCAMALAACAGPVACGAAGLLGASNAGPLALGLCALFPSVLLFSPGVDQCFPLLSVLLVVVLAQAARGRSLVWGAVGGLAMYVCLTLSLAFVVVAAVASAYVALASFSGRDALLRGVKIGASAAAAFALAGLLAWLLTGYDTVGVVRRCLRYNSEFNQAARGGYWCWLLYNPLAFALFMGGPAVAVWLGGTGLALWRTVRTRRVADVDRLALATAAVIALLLLSGQNRGEINRLWMLLMPVCVVGGLCALELRKPLGPRLVFWLALMQALQVVVFRVCYDAWDIARYIEHGLV